MYQQFKNFTFKEENTKCNLHQEVNRFICKCSQKFCSKCLTENKDTNNHFKIHSDYKLFHIKDLKSLYINQVEEIENIIKEIYEENEESSFKQQERKKLLNESFALKELKSNLINLINLKIEKHFEYMFEQEEKNLEEMIKVTNSSDSVLDSEGIIYSIEKLIKLKEIGKLSVITTFEKMNSVQNSFIGKIERLLKEFGILMKKYFDNELDSKIEKEELNYQVKLNRDEDCTPGIERENKSRSKESEAHDIPSNEFLRAIEKSPIECESPLIKHSSKEKKSEIKKNKTLVLSLNLNISSSNNKDFKLYNLEDIPDSHNSKNSLMNTLTNFAEEANILTNSNYKNVQSNSLWKEGLIPEISGSINEISQRQNSHKINLNDMTNSSVSEENKSYVTEFNINKDNRNRINKIIFYKKQRRTENLYRSPKINTKKKYISNHFHRISGQITPINFNNLNPAYGLQAKGFSSIADVACRENNLHEGGCLMEQDKHHLNSKSIVLNRTCVDCFSPFSVKNVNNWKKRCVPCQKTFYEKISSIKNFYTTNSYKAGKMNQTCLKCKNSFIVPVALAKQRKTCYYCFKGSINNH